MSKARRLSSLVAASMLMLASACSSDEQPATSKVAPRTVQGVAQKGPFFVGSTVTIQELSERLDPLGKVYVTTVTDDFGSFRLGTPVQSPFIEVIVDGVFFNEVSTVHRERLVLHAIARADDGTSALQLDVNVNLLTHLQSARLKRLVEEGASFSTAEAQSRGEVLAALALPPLEVSAHGLSIVGADTSSAELLALSILVQQAAVTVATTGDSAPGVPELAGVLRQDLVDGTLDDIQAAGALTNARAIFARGHYSPARGVDSLIPNVADALRKHYSDRGATVTVPDWFAFFAGTGGGTTETEQSP